MEGDDIYDVDIVDYHWKGAERMPMKNPVRPGVIIWDGCRGDDHMWFAANEAIIAAMPSITIRNVPARTRNELASRAALAGRSLQEHLRLALIDLADRPDPEVLMAEVRQRKQGGVRTLTSEEILRFRDSGRR